MINERKLSSIVKKCIDLSANERPELIWLSKKYEEFMIKMNISKKSEADRLLYERMYARHPQNEAALSKIRFWRTGKHMPVNREQLFLLGKALDLNQEEYEYLLKNYAEKNDLLFEKADEENDIYKSRRELMEELVNEYFLKVHPSKLLELNISPSEVKHNFRHLYYTDSLKYVSLSNIAQTDSHMASINYASELNRNMNLLGEIPRKTMLRHLFILGIPFINLEIINKYLVAFGYLPLTENHTLVGGEALDFLLINVLNLYEKECKQESTEYCIQWLKQTFCMLDKMFQNSKMEALRFMYYKALDSGDK